MKMIQELAVSLNILPKLRLGVKLEKGGVRATGPHTVKFLEEPIGITGKDVSGKPRKELKFVVEENGTKYRWNVPVLNKEGQPNYLVENLMHVEVGDTRILEMCKSGAKNFIDVREVDALPEVPDEEEVIDFLNEDPLKHGDK